MNFDSVILLLAEAIILLKMKKKVWRLRTLKQAQFFIELE